jgi:hypothetical protein
MYKIRTDSVLEIGSSHDICEDYIIHGITENDVPYIILSDGCSSSKYTDIGARIFVHIIKKLINNMICYLNDDYHLNILYKTHQLDIIYKVNNIIELLGLPKESLDCTLIFAFIINDKCYIYRYGDGSIIIEYTNNNIFINSVDFIKNNPYYLSYLLNPKINNDYFENIGDYYLDKTHILEDDNGCIMSDEKEIIKLIEDRTVEIIDLKNVKNILISSDGIDSFLNKRDGKNIPADQLIYNILDFKNLNGNFLKRTLKSKKGVLNQLKKQNIINFDDISIGCFNIQEELIK